MDFRAWIPLVCLFPVAFCGTNNDSAITAELLIEMGSQHKGFALLHLLGKAFQTLEANLEKQLQEKEADVFQGDFPGNGTFATLVCSVLDCSSWTEWPRCDDAAAGYAVVTRTRQCRASSPLCNYGNGNENKTEVQERICSAGNMEELSPAVLCPPSFTMIQGFCLLYVPMGMYQNAASDYCQDFDNGELIHVDSLAKRDAMYELLERENVGSSVIWLNGKRQAQYGDFHYTYGNQNPSYSNWCSGEPSNGSNELCEVSEGSDRCRWDRNCDNSYKFVCEVPL